MSNNVVWAKRNPYDALLGISGPGASIPGLHQLYASKKLEKTAACKGGLNPDTLKAAMVKVADTAMRNPTAGGMYNIPRSPQPTPSPQPQQPPAPPPGQQQPQGSMSQPTGQPGGTTGQQGQQLNNTWRTTAADQLGQNMGGGQQSGQQQGGGQSQGQ